MANPRRTAWADSINSTVLASGSELTAMNLLVNAPASDTITVARIIGVIEAVPADGFEAVNTTSSLHVGIGVTSLEAFNAGVVPNPNVSNEYPPRGWLYIDRRVLYQAPALTNGFKYPEFRFDVRGARLVDKGILFISLLNILDQNAAMTMLLTWRIRAVCLT